MKSYLQGHLKRLLDGIFKLDQSKGENNSLNWDGTVTLKALPLDPNLFSFLNLDTVIPLKLIRGCIDELSISVPWLYLGRDSVSFKAKNCFALLRLDMSDLYNFDKRNQQIKKKKILESVERRVVDTFKQLQQKKSTYIENFLLSMLKTCQADIENLRIKVEIVEFEEVVGGIELVFNELKYENSVTAIANTSLQNTQETNGLRIVDLRLKSLSKDKLLLLKYTEAEISSAKVTLQSFKDLFKNEENPKYIVAPILLQFNFSRIYDDESKKQYTRFVQFEVSPILLGVSNEDLKLANTILSCYQLTQEYAFEGRVLLPYSLRTAELMAAFDRHRLLRALVRAFEGRALRKKTGALLQAFRALKTEYEFGYEIKILHLMEKQFDKDTEKLYQKNMLVNVPFKENAECTVDDLISRIEELEKSSRLEVILALRDNVMERLRNQGYFKKVLLERKAAIKAKQEKGTGVISDLLRKGISGILGSKKEAKHFDDFIPDIEQSESALQTKLNTAAIRIGSILEVNCPSMVLSLTRNSKLLLELALSDVKYKESEQVDTQKLSSRLSVSEASLFDEVKSRYARISYISKTDPKPKTNTEEYPRERSSKEKGFEILIESNLQPHLETGEVRRIMSSLDILAGKIYLNLGKELLSKLVYFTTDFSQLAKKVHSPSHARKQSNFAPPNSTEYTMSWGEKVVEPSQLRQKSTFELQMLKLIDLDKKFLSHFSIKIEELAIVCKHSLQGDWVGIYTKPNLKLVKNELSLKMMLFQILHSDNSSTLSALENGLQNLCELDGIKKLIKPMNIKAMLPRRDRNRVSLDVNLDCLQIFLSDEFLFRIVKICQDFETIKVLNTESMLIDLKKTAKQPSKKPAAKLSNQLISNRNKIGSITERSIKASRKGSSNTFMTAQSDLMNEEFFDAFEDETDLLAHQELKNRIDLIQSAAIAMNSSVTDLHVIDEDNRYRQEKPAASTNLQTKYKYVNFSMSLKFEDLSLILYSSNELENYIQTYFTKGYIFFDYSKLELQFSECTMILKQNLLTLLNKDILPLFGTINKVVQSVLKKQGGATIQSAELQVDEKPTAGSNFVSKLGELVTKKPHPITVSLQLASQISIYLTEQIENMIIPGIFLSVRPMKAKPKAPVQPLAELGNQGLQIKCDVKIDVFNGGEVAYYEPFIEEMIFESTLYFEGEQLKQDILFQNLLLNVKPSILKNLLDTLSTYSTQNIKRSAELHSVMTIRNETGILMSITANSSGKARQLKPFETVKINLFTSAKTDRQQEQLEGADKTYRDSDLSINGVCYFKNRESVLKLIGRVSDDDGGSKQYEVNKTNLNTTSYFGKKRLVLELESFGKQLNIDLSNMTDTEFQLSDYVFLVAKVESLRDQTLLTLTSNLKITNKLDHDVESAIYLRKTVVSKEDFGKTFASKVKKRKGSGVFSDGDHLSDHISVDFNEPITGNTFSFPNTTNSSDPKALQSSGIGFKFGMQAQESTEKEERSSLVFRSIVRSGGSIFLPLLKNFPVNYYMITIPATESFFHSTSKNPSLEYNRVKTQNEKSNRIYFDELMRKDCGITSHQLEHSVSGVANDRNTIG